MSSKNSSLAVDETKEQSQEKEYESGFEPNLQVLINKRFIHDSDSATNGAPINIRGRITISF